VLNTVFIPCRFIFFHFFKDKGIIVNLDRQYQSLR
jgi:hypothetical protein